MGLCCDDEEKLLTWRYPKMSYPNLTALLLQVNKWPAPQLANLKLSQVSLCYVPPCSQQLIQLLLVSLRSNLLCHLGSYSSKRKQSLERSQIQLPAGHFIYWTLQTYLLIQVKFSKWGERVVKCLNFLEQREFFAFFSQTWFKGRFGNLSETGRGRLSLLFPSALRVIQSGIWSMLSSMIPRPWCAGAGEGIESNLATARASEQERLLWRRNVAPWGLVWPWAVGLREEKWPTASRWALQGAHCPRGFAHQPSVLSKYIQTHFSHKVEKHFSVLAEWTPQQPVFAQNSPCLITRMINLLIENLHKGNTWGWGWCMLQRGGFRRGGDVVGVCPAWGSEPQGFQRAHRFLGSTQHLTGSGLHALCRAPY